MFSLPQIQQELKNLLEDDIQMTIQQLKDYLSSDSNLHNDLISINAQFKTLNTDYYIRDIIDYQEFIKEKVKIQTGLLLLIDRLKGRDLKSIPQHFPDHIIPLAAQIEKVSQLAIPHYKDYIFDENLLYISRADFLRQREENHDDFLTEQGMLKQILHESHYYKGLVIYGKGGIGKTRLMYELGRLAMKQGWQVWIIQKEVKDFFSFSQFINPNEKHILLFDYLEESLAFHAHLHQEFKQIPESNLKLIVNCRNTFRNSCKFPNENFFMHVNLDFEAHPLQESYQRFVTQQILQQIQQLNIERFSHQSIKPVLAVFLKYLDSHQLIKQSDIQNLKAYKNWIQRRLAISFRVAHFSDLRREICFLLMALPLKDVARNRLETDFEQEIEILEQDGWIEVDSEAKLVTFHDTVVDELVLSHFSNRIWLKNSLHFSIKYGALYNWLRALERVKDHLYQSHHISTVHQLIQQEITSFANIPYQWATSSLFDEAQRMDLLNRNLSLFEPFIQTKDFIKVLAYSLNELSKGKRPLEQVQSVKKVLETWVSFYPDFVQNRNIPIKYISKILSTSIKAFGAEQNLKYLQDYLAIPFFSDQACFVLAAWLKQKGNKKEIQSYLQRFLKQKSTDENTQFVLKEWLHAEGDLKFIQPYLQQFLSKNSQVEGTRLVLQAWMERGGDLLLIQPALERYLQKFSTQIDSRHLIEKWLATKMEAAFLVPYIGAWMSHFSTTLKEAQYVFRACLTHQQSPDFIQKWLGEHLNNHAAHLESRFVLQDWMKYGGNLAFIQPYLDTHLQAYGTKFFTRHLLQTWLQQGGDATCIQTTVVSYLEHHPSNEHTRFVLNSWLQFGGNAETVQPYFLHYLETMPLVENSYFLFSFWKEAGGDLELIKSYAVNWLEAFPESKYAKTLKIKMDF